MTETDRSREGHLIHEASSSGRDVRVVAYLEGLKRPVESRIICRTAEQATELARVLSEATFTPQ
jgi:hypothetical protein